MSLSELLSPTRLRPLSASMGLLKLESEGPKWYNKEVRWRAGRDLEMELEFAAGRFFAGWPQVATLEWERGFCYHKHQIEIERVGGWISAWTDS